MISIHGTPFVPLQLAMALEELQKGIQAEDEKPQLEQQSHNQHDDFHANISVKG